LNKSTHDRKKMQNGPILVIDGFNLLIRCFVVLPTMNENGEHNGALYGSLNSLKSYVKKFRPSKVIIAWDGPGGSKRRQKLFANYKSGRKVPRRMCRAYDFLSPEEERQSMFEQLDRYKEYLSELPVYQLRAEMTEADDIIAWVSHFYKNENVVIISTDKDFYQLVTDNTQIYNPVTKKMLGTQDIYDKFSIMPKNFVLARTLTGDPSDSIDGIKGIGLKTSIKLFPMINEDRRLFPKDILDHAEKQDTKSKKYQKIINEREKVERNYKIMQLRDPLVSSSDVTKMITVLEKNTHSNIPKMRQMFIMDSMWSQIKNFDDWVLNFVPLRTKENK